MARATVALLPFALDKAFRRALSDIFKTSQSSLYRQPHEAHCQRGTDRADSCRVVHATGVSSVAFYYLKCIS